MSSVWANVALVLLFVLVGGVFAATEMALVSLRDSQLRALATALQLDELVVGARVERQERVRAQPLHEAFARTLRQWIQHSIPAHRDGALDCTHGPPNLCSSPSPGQGRSEERPMLRRDPCPHIAVEASPPW